MSKEGLSFHRFRLIYLKAFVFYLIIEWRSVQVFVSFCIHAGEIHSQYLSWKPLSLGQKVMGKNLPIKIPILVTLAIVSSEKEIKEHLPSVRQKAK